MTLVRNEKGIHPLSQTLYGFMTFLSTRSECCDEGCGTIGNYKDRIRFTSDFNVNMVNDNNVPKNFSPKARHLAPLHRWLLLDAVLTTLHNILVEFMNIFGQTQA